MKTSLSLLTPAALLIATSAATALAQEPPAPKPLIEIGSGFSVDADARLRAEAATSLRGDHEKFKRVGAESSLVLSVAWKDAARAVLKARLDEIFEKEGFRSNSDFDWQRFVEEAYIQLGTLDGFPVALVIGKHQAAFGTQMAKMPMFAQNPLFQLQQEKEVIGMTLRLDPSFFTDVVDEIEASWFDSGEGDLRIGKLNGLSVRLTKGLTEQLLVRASYVHEGRGNHAGESPESRASLGLIYEEADGSFSAWLEGIRLDQSAQYPGSRYAVTGGIAIRPGFMPWGEIVAEASYVERSVLELAGGVNVAATRNLTIGPEVRYREDRELGESDTFVGIAGELYLGTSGRWENQRTIFGELKKAAKP